MKKKNGFTLVELLAVIVVLAIIMIIAIPSVLNVMNNARRETFVLYVEDTVKNVITQYVSDAASSIQGAGVYVYNITTDLGKLTTGNYKGYVIVDAVNVDDPKYNVFIWDNNYMIVNYQANNGFPDASDTVNIQPYNANTEAEKFSNAVKACKSYLGSRDDACMNRQGFILTD